MADIIEEVEEVAAPDQPEVENQEKVEAKLEKELTPIKEDPVVQEETAPKEEDDLPEKYKGKSAKEIAEMHQQAERLIGKQGSEVGELRKVVDDLFLHKLRKNHRLR